MKVQSVLRNSGGLAALALLWAMGSAVIAAQSVDSSEISKVLTEAKSHAVLAADDAASLESYARTTVSWKSHSGKIAEITEYVNALGKVNQELSDLSSQGSPWQQKAITEVDSLLRDMATHLTATINHFNDNQSRIHMQPYRDYAHANYELASKTAQVIRDFVEYDKATSKAEALEQKLDLSVADKGE